MADQAPQQSNGVIVNASAKDIAAQRAAGEPTVISSAKPVDQTETEALAAFRQKLVEAGLYEPEKDGQEASHPDLTLLRFLRARKNNISGAFDQFKACEEFRAKYNADTIYDQPEFDTQTVARRKGMYPAFLGRLDRKGLPIYIHKISRLTADALTEVLALSEEQRRAFEIAGQEERMRIIGTYAGPDIVTCTNIADVGNVSLTDFWRLRKFFAWSSHMNSANYPETLGIAIVVNAPWYISKLWSYVGALLDKGTVEKIHVLARGDSLEKWIDPSDIPKEYGGQLDWEAGQEPAWPVGKGEAEGWYGQTEERGKKGTNGDIPRGNAHSNRVKLTKAKGPTQGVAASSQDAKIAENGTTATVNPAGIEA